MTSRAVLLSLILAACSKSGRPPVGAPAAATTPAAPQVQEREIDVGDVTLHVREVGEASATATLVVLHGGPGISHEYTRGLEALVADGYRVVTFDQRGTGRSTSPADEDAYRLTDLAGDLERLRVALGTERIDVAGHSFGGLIAMQYAVTYPAHVRSMTLIDSAAVRDDAMMLGQMYMSERVGEMQEQGFIAGRAPPQGTDCAPAVLSVMPAYYFDPRHPATKDLGGSTCRADTFERTLEASAGLALEPALAELEMPTLVIHGEADPFGREGVDHIVASLTRARPDVHILPRCGHLPWVECPAPFFVAMRAFLAARP